MPEFLNPFTGVVPGRKLTHSELVRALVYPTQGTLCPEKIKNSSFNC